MVLTKKEKEIANNLGELNPKLKNKYACKYCKAKLDNDDRMWILRTIGKTTKLDFSLKCNKCGKISIKTIKEKKLLKSLGLT